MTSKHLYNEETRENGEDIFYFFLEWVSERKNWQQKSREEEDKANWSHMTSSL